MSLASAQSSWNSSTYNPAKGVGAGAFVSLKVIASQNSENSLFRPLSTVDTPVNVLTDLPYTTTEAEDIFVEVCGTVQQSGAIPAPVAGTVSFKVIATLTPEPPASLNPQILATGANLTIQNVASWTAQYSATGSIKNVASGTTVVVEVLATPNTTNTTSVLGVGCLIFSQPATPA